MAWEVEEADDDWQGATKNDIAQLIYGKIAAGVSTKVEVPGLRPFRELLQNADDAKSTCLSFRFDSDKLIVHNDGFTMKEKFLEDIQIIHKASKKNDPDTSGTFGTGFRSTYLYSDEPEMEWIYPNPKKKGKGTYRLFGIPLGMFGNLTWNKIKFRKNTLEMQYKTFDRENEVFEDGSSRLGVMFRFPWRVENQWEDMPEWSDYEWSREDVSGLASDFREYALKALLGCRHLKTIRVVCAGCETPSKRWDFVVTRDRTVSEIREDDSNPDEIDTEMNFSSATFTRDDSFFDLSGKGVWKRSPSSGHGWYDIRGLPEEVNASPDCRRLGYGIYGTAVSKDLSKRENFWDIALLALPLSPDAPSLPVYTPVPLASLTGNRFGIIAMLPPIENRLGIDISGSYDYRRNWLKRNIDAAAKLYGKRIDEHIKKIGERVDGAAAESTVISCLPRNAPSKWFATRGIEELAEMTPEKTRQIPFRKVIDALGWITGNSAKMAWSKGALMPLKDTVHYWSENDSQPLEEVLEILDAPVLSSAWKDYWEEVRGSSNFFYNAVKDQLFRYNDGGRNQRYGSKSLSSPLQFAKTVRGSWENARESDRLDRLAEILLGGVCTEHLVEEWGKEHPRDIMEIPCIISQDDRLRRIANFYDTESVPELIHILNPSGLVKEGDRKAVFETLRAPKTKLAKAIRDATTPTGRVILQLIHADTEANPEVHDDLEGNPVVYKAVSELLEKALEEDTDKVRNDLDADEVKFLRFVPCRRHGRVMTLQGNILEAESKESAPHRSLSARTRTWGFSDVWSGHTFLSRQYHREFIFREMPPDVDALPECVVRRLRFIALHEDVVDPGRVQKRLKLNVVGDPPAEGKKMKRTNLVRSLLFEHGQNLIGENQDSLFREGEFERWLTGQPAHLSSKEQKDLDEGGAACAERWLAEIKGVDLDEAKTSLLVKLLSPYGDKVGGGNGVKNATKDAKNQELLFVLGEDGLWKHGSRFCLALDSELTEFVDEVAAVDESLMPPNLSLTILQQLGVQESLSPSIALPAVRKCLSEKNADALALILGSLASSPTHWMGTDVPKDDREAWDDLMNQHAWIPTVGGVLLRPDLVLKPDETHRELLGEGYENFPAKSTWAKLEGEHAGDRTAELGMRGEVEDGLLLLAYCGKHTSGNDPGLAIRELAKRIKKRVQPVLDKLVWGPHDKIHRDDFVVYTKGGGSFTLGEYFQVWVTETARESEELKELWPSAEAVPLDRLEHFDSTVFEAVRKLGLLKQGPSYNDILTALTKPGDYDTASTLWKRLCRIAPPDPKEEMERIGANDYRDNNRTHRKALYPHGGELLSLDQITLTDDTDMHGETSLDEKTLVCPGRIHPPEGANLKAWLLRLGVEEEAEEDPSKVLGRLSGNTYDIESQSTTLHAIKRKIATQDPKGPGHLLRWSSSESVKLVRAANKTGHPLKDIELQLIDPQDTEPWIIRRFAEKELPIIHSEVDDPPEYLFWLTQLDTPGVTPFSSLVSHEVITHDIDDRYQRQASLELAITQSVKAMSLSYPKEFETDDEFTIECWIGSGGIPLRMVVEWKRSSKGIRRGFEDNACVYEGDGLRMFIDQDKRKGGNTAICSRLLIDELVSDDCPWFPRLKRRYANEGTRFLNRLKVLLQELLDSPTDEWEDISITTRGEEPANLGAKLDEVSFIPKPHPRLFETNTEREMRLMLKGAYGGCQICRRVTPMSETTDETNESLIHIIKNRGQYYGKPDDSRPMGRQLWLCARHRILWDRKLIRFQFMDAAFEGKYSRRGHIPPGVLKRGLEKLEEHRDGWKKDSDMGMMVYDSNLEHEDIDLWGPEEGSEEFNLLTNWRERNMKVTKKHAQGILDQMIDWLMRDQSLH